MSNSHTGPFHQSNKKPFKNLHRQLVEDFFRVYTPNSLP